MSNLIPVERVAEGLWQTVNGVDGDGIAAHEVWLALTEADKELWRAHAVEAIDAWKKSHGYA